MSMLYLTGKNANFIRRGANSAGNALVTCSPAASTVSPITNLYDDDPSSPFAFGSVAADPWIYTELNAFRDGGFEAACDGVAGTEAGATGDRWALGYTGTGSAVRTTTAGEYETLTAGLKLNAGASGTAWAEQTVRVNAGEKRKIRLRYKTGTASGVKLIVQNKATGLYLSSGGTWGGYGYAWNSVTADSTWREGATSYTVESYALSGGNDLLLRVLVYCDTNGAVYVDAVADCPETNFCSFHGFSVDPFITKVLWSSYHINEIGFSSRATLVQSAQPSFWGSLGAGIYDWNWKLILTGTPLAAPSLGEWVLGQAVTCATSPEWGFQVTQTMPGVRQTGPSGRPAVYNYSTSPVRNLKISVSSRSASASAEIENIWRRSGQGLYPVVIVPIDTETDVFYGRLMAPQMTVRPFSGIYETTLELVGDPLPTVGL